jgi:hypothetical protein
VEPAVVWLYRFVCRFCVVAEEQGSFLLAVALYLVPSAHTKGKEDKLTLLFIIGLIA